jgi:predicted GNAT family acetyltransferase
MLVRRHTRAEDYLAAVGPTLRRRPVINQLAIAIAQTCVREPDRYGADVAFYSVERDGAIVGAALQTRPWPVQIAESTAEAARLLARAFAANEPPLAGVAGPDAAPEEFARAYGSERGVTYALEVALGTFELTSVNELPEVAGRRVVASSEHAPLLQEWLGAFHDEATPQNPPLSADAGERAVATGRAHLWLDDNDHPVSYAFHNRDVEGWASVGPVYTPPEARGRGFATALVAAVSRGLLAEGRPGCTLFTDLANPTSNAIYERIGYRRVGSAFRYGFAASEQGR